MVDIENPNALLHDDNEICEFFQTISYLRKCIYFRIYIKFIPSEVRSGAKRRGEQRGRLRFLMTMIDT